MAASASQAKRSVKEEASTLPADAATAGKSILVE
jgi:hypothetical protein